MTTIRKNITQPAAWWAAFEAQSQCEGLTLSEWVGECCRANLPAEQQQKLKDRPPAHRPRTNTDPPGRKSC